MKSEQQAKKVIDVAYAILYEDVSQGDLSDFGLDEQSLKIAQGLLSDIDRSDLSVPGNHTRIFFDPDDKEYKATLDKVIHFYSTLGFNISEIQSEYDKDEMGDGEVKHDGYDISTTWKHFDTLFFLPSDGVSRDLYDNTLRENIICLTRYPDDFSEKDFLETERLLRHLGEQRWADVIKNTYLSKEYTEQAEDAFIDVYQIKAEYLTELIKMNGYVGRHEISGSLEKDGITYEWHLELPVNLGIQLFKPLEAVISYQDNESGALGANKISVDEFLKMDAVDFEHFVNESMFYDNEFQEQKLEYEDYLQQ